MNLELNVRFPDPTHVIVSYDGGDTDALDFAAPLGAKELEDIRWYLEVYATRYTTEVDDKAAARIAEALPRWGAQLFEAVFATRAAQPPFWQRLPTNSSAAPRRRNTGGWRGRRGPILRARSTSCRNMRR